MVAGLVWNESALRELERDPRGPVGQDLSRSGWKVQQVAQNRAPVLTGMLQSMISFEVGADGDGLHLDLLTRARSARGFPYGALQEFRQPYLRPALDAIRR